MLSFSKSGGFRFQANSKQDLRRNSVYGVYLINISNIYITISALA